MVQPVLASMRLDTHAVKTFLGQMQRGFPFLGYHFSPGGLMVAAKTIDYVVEHMHQPYEQESSTGAPLPAQQGRAAVGLGSQCKATNPAADVASWPQQ